MTRSLTPDWNDRRMFRPHHFRIDSVLSIAAMLAAVAGCSETPASGPAADASSDAPIVAPTMETETLVQSALADSAVEHQRTAVVQLQERAMKATSVDEVNRLSAPARMFHVKIPSSSGTVGEGTADMKAVEGLRHVLANSTQPSIRAEAAIGLGATRDVESMPTLLDAMADDSLEVRHAAGYAVYRIIGYNAAFVPDGPVDERAKAIGLYRKFWGKNKDSWWGKMMRSPEDHEVRRKAIKKLQQ